MKYSPPSASEYDAATPSLMVSPLVQVLGDVAVAVGADVVGGAVVVGGGTGAVVVATGAGLVVVAAGAGLVVVAAGAGAVVAAVGAVVGVGFTPPLWTLKCPRRVEVVPSDHFSTARMVCEPSESLEVSYARAVPSAAVPAKSKGACLSVATGGRFVRRALSR